MRRESYQGVYTPSRLHAAMIIALCGGATWVAMSQVESLRMSFDDLTMVRLTTGMAWLGGLIAVPLLGRPGVIGVVLSLIGSVLATAIGAALAAGVLDPVGLVMGPIFVFAMVLQSPLVACVWVIGMTLAHAAAAPPISPESSGST